MKFASISTFLQRLFHLNRVGGHFESPRYLLKWLLISSLIGFVAGAGAIVFTMAIKFATQFFLGWLVGYMPPDPSGEGTMGVMPLWTAARPWLLPIVTTVGGLLSGILVFSLAPEAEGHGTDAAIAAFHHDTPIRGRIPLVKLVASAITIGSGGSAGREGPSAQISAGFGSLLGKLLNLNTQDRRLAIAIGIGAGIGAIFRAPLGGAVLAAEILYKHDLEVEAIIPALIASIIGFSVFGAWFGWNPIFATPTSLAFTSPAQLLYYILIGLLCGMIGLLYARGFYGITHRFHKLQLPKWLKPAIGGLCVGLIGLVLPEALGMGYGWVQISMGTGLLGIPLWVILLLPFAKIVTTGLSIGSGGSGGIFGPGMVIGGMVGAVIWRLSYHVLPGVPTTPAPFVIVGMMALFGGIAHAPLAVMLMVAEMTGNLSLLAPAMLAVGISVIIVGEKTIYTSQVDTRSDSPAHRLQFSFPLLSTLTVQQAMASLDMSFTPRQTVAEAESMLAESVINGAPVLDSNARLMGVLTLADIEHIPFSERGQCLVEEAMNREVLTVQADETLDVALEQLTSHRVGWMPVIEAESTTGERLVVGRISAPDITRQYRETTTKDSRRLRELAQGTVMVEALIEPDMQLAGHSLRDATLPQQCLIVSIRRQKAMLPPRGSTIIEPGDTVTFLVSPGSEILLRRYLEERVEHKEPIMLD